MTSEKSKSNKFWISKLFLIFVAISLWELFHFIRMALNPTDLNHVVIVSEIEDGELTLDFDERVDRNIFGYGVEVIDIRRQFTAGEIRIRNNGKNTIRDLLPPRRWGATLVIFCKDDGTSRVGWNQIEFEEKK